MNVKEMIDKIRELEQEYCMINGDGDYIVGVRYENKLREVGEEIDNSRHNLEREDEREMPEYGTEEYEEMFELDGASAYEVDEIISMLENGVGVEGNHMYFIAGTDAVNLDDAIDHGEVVVANAEVVYRFY